MTEPRESDAQVDQILFGCLDRPEEEWPAALEQACREHERLAPRLADRFAMLRSFGMVARERGRPSVVGGYELIEPIGSGAMGTVFLARRPAAAHGGEDGDVRVALKILHTGLRLSPAAQRRFAREQAMAARLHHPGICAVIETGDADGVPFIAMEHVEGQSLAERIASNKRAGRRPDSGEIGEILTIIEGVARALHAAYAEGLVHRDVKPSNVIVRENGQPVLLDFGLARDVDEAGSRLTLSGSLLGSPAYLAPEVIDGRAPLDGQGDVYSLGVTLFECLTLDLPFSSPTREVLFHKILRDPNPDPRRLNPAVGPELANVVRTAMAKHPDRRYASALAFADDLAAVREGRAVAARTATLTERCKAWTRRYPIVTVFLLMLVVGLVTTAVLLHEVSSGLSRMHALGLAAVAAGSEPELAILLATRAVELHEHPVTVTELQAAVARYHRRVVYPRVDGRILDCRFRPGGAGIVLLSSLQRLQICDPNGGVEVQLEGVLDAEPGPEPAEVLIRRKDGAFLWRAGAGELVPVVPGRVLAIQVVGTRTLVVAAAGDGLAVLHRSDGLPPTPLGRLGEGPARAVIAKSGQTVFLEDGKQVTRFDASGDVLCRVPGERLLTSSHSGSSWVTRQGRTKSWYDVPADSAPARPSPILTFGIESTLFRLSASGQRLAVCQRGLSVRIYDERGQVIGTVPPHGVPVGGLSFSLDGRFLATGDGDAVARLYSEDGSLIAELHGHDGHVTHTEFSPDGEQLATGSYDGGARVFQIRPGVEHLLDGSRTPVVALSTDGDGRVIWVEKGGNLWLAHEGATKIIASEVSKAVFGGVREIVASFRDGRCLVIDADGEREPRTIAELRDGESLVDLSVSADRGWLVGVTRLSGTADRGFVHLWRRDGAWTSHVTREIAAPLLTADVAAGGARIATAGQDGVARIHDREGRELARFRAHDDWVWSVRFSPEGDALLTTSRDNTARLWSLDGTRLGQFQEHARTVPRGVFSPDGELIATASTDHTVGIWERSGRLRALLRGHRGQVWDVVFSEDGESVISGAYDQSVRIWPVETRRLLELARSLVDRPLTPREQESLGDHLGR